MECLSAKTLSGRSSRNLTNRITMSAPLIYSSSSLSRQIQNRPSHTPLEDTFHQFPIPGYIITMPFSFFALAKSEIVLVSYD